MRLTKFGHSAVRIEHDGTTVAVDPGVWSQREAVEGCPVCEGTMEPETVEPAPAHRKSGARAAKR